MAATVVTAAAMAGPPPAATAAVVVAAAVAAVRLAGRGTLGAHRAAMAAGAEAVAAPAEVPVAQVAMAGWGAREPGAAAPEGAEAPAATVGTLGRTDRRARLSHRLR